MKKMKPSTKSDAYKSILIISILAILGVSVYIAVTLTGYVGYPMMDVNIFLATIGSVLAIAGLGLVAYPEDRTTGVGIALMVIGGFLLVQILLTLTA